MKRISLRYQWVTGLVVLGAVGCAAEPDARDATGDVAGNAEEVAVVQEALAESPWFGGQTGQVHSYYYSNSLLDYTYMRGGSFVDRIYLEGPGVKFGPWGGNGGSEYQSRCPTGSWISGIYGYAGAYLDQLGFYCFNKITGDTTPLLAVGLPGGSPFGFMCPNQTFVRGVEIREIQTDGGLYIEGIGVQCG